jgi:hypothetical protein
MLFTYCFSLSLLEATSRISECFSLPGFLMAPILPEEGSNPVQ